MSSYALLVSPSANRVYARAAAALTVAELGVLAETVLAGRLGEARSGGGRGRRVRDVRRRPRRPTALGHVANVSTAFALFERTADDAFRPVPLERLDCLDDDLLTILKYQGKTNELFTKLLLNVTVLASGSAGRMLTDRLRVLDPLCGRGTTLNQVLMYGWHAAGVDLDERDFDAYAAFLPRWLKDKRLKHTATTAKLRRDGRTLGRRLDVELATSKEAWAAGDTITLSTALADTRETAEVFRAGERRRGRHRRAVRRAARQPVGPAASSGGRWSCWPRPCPAGSAAAATRGSGRHRGQRPHLPARRGARAARATPAWSRATPRRTAASSTGSTRRSCATSWSL